ncbi:MAG: tyrosine-type recombinase/integrase [Pseudomonadota bacterium]
MAKLPFTYVVRKKSGREYWYHRTMGRITGEPGSPEFHADYATKEKARKSKDPEPERGSFDELIARFLKSQEYIGLAEETQADYAATCELLRAELIDENDKSLPYLYTTRKMIKAVRDGHAQTPRKAHKIKQMVSRLYTWADENDLVPEGMNPARGIKRLRDASKGERELVVWSDYEIELFMRHARPVVRTPAMLALYTGQRAKNIAAMTWNDYQGDIIRVRQSKTGARLDIACHPDLRSYLDALPRDNVVIATTATGRPFNSNSLSTAIYREREMIEGMPDRSLHGLRYAAGSRLSEAGCEVAEIEAVLGHETFKMAMKYAGQRIRARSAISRLDSRGKA